MQIFRIVLFLLLLLSPAGAVEKFCSQYWGCINVRDYGAVGNGSTDDTAAIQAAIDAAYAANIQTTYLPPTGNCYKTTSRLKLDAPGNNPSSPTIFNFSLSLVGEDGIGNHENFGSRICPNFNNDIALYVGTGQGMHVRGLQIVGPAVLYRGLQNASGVGIGIAGGSGGPSRTLIENVWIENFYTGIKTAANGVDTLADSNTFRKIVITNAAQGIYIAGTQSFINSCYDCSINYTTMAFRSDVGGGLHVFGGNPSGVSGVSASFSISAMSALTATASGASFDYTFTATVASPDDYIKGGVYNAFTIATTHFGVVPITLTSFNSGTNVGTFKIWHAWSVYYFPGANAQSDTTLQTEMQAASTLYAAEMLMVAKGSNVHLDGVHIENPSAPTIFFDTASGFGDARPSSAKNIFFDYDPSLSGFRPSNSPSAAQLAQYYAAALFPFISISGAGDLTIESSQYSLTTDPVIIDWPNDGDATGQLYVKDIKNFRVNTRTVSSSGGFSSFGIRAAINTSSLGGGIYDTSYFLTYGTIKPLADYLRSSGWQSSPQWGWRPAPFSAPAIAPAQLTTLGSLPTISYSGGSFTIDYPVIWGGQIYKLWDWYTGVQAGGYQFISNHHFYSYGQNLTTSNVPNLAWNYKGQSFAVNCNDECLRIVFPGLGMKLNDGSSDVLYMTTGVYPGLGYFTVTGAQSITDNSRLSGTKTSTITGTTIKQEAYSITQF